MRRTDVTKCVLWIGLLVCLPKPARCVAADVAADAPAYNSPAAVIAAAEEAYGKGDYKTYAACFDAAGQKIANKGSIQMLIVYMGLTPDGHGKEAKAVLAKYGVTDVSKQSDEPDDHFAERLVGLIKDPAGFMAEATPVVTPKQEHIHRIKGTLRGLIIDGQTARATYVVKPRQVEMTQDITFVKTGGSWKISCMMDMEANVIAGNG